MRDQLKRHDARDTIIIQSCISAIISLICMISCGLYGCDDVQTSYFLTDNVYEKTHEKTQLDLDQLEPPRGLYDRYIMGSIITFNVYREFDLHIVDELSVRSDDHALLEPLAGHCGDQCSARSILDDPYDDPPDQMGIHKHSQAFRVRRPGVTKISLYVSDKLVESHVVNLIHADHIEATLDLSVSGQLMTQFGVSSEDLTSS